MIAIEKLKKGKEVDCKDRFVMWFLWLESQLYLCTYNVPVLVLQAGVVEIVDACTT